MNAFQKSSFVLIFHVIALSSVVAKDYELNLSLCEIKTDCKLCIEDISVKFKVDDNRKTVTVSGRASTGERVEEVLVRCSVKSTSDWQCEEFRGLIMVTNGKLTFSSRQTLFEKDFEICPR